MILENSKTNRQSCSSKMLQLVGMWQRKENSRLLVSPFFVNCQFQTWHLQVIHASKKNGNFNFNIFITELYIYIIIITMKEKYLFHMVREKIKRYVRGTQSSHWLSGWLSLC